MLNILNKPLIFMCKYSSVVRPWVVLEAMNVFLKEHWVKYLSDVRVSFDHTFSMLWDDKALDNRSQLKLTEMGSNWGLAGNKYCYNTRSFSKKVIRLSLSAFCHQRGAGRIEKNEGQTRMLWKEQKAALKCPDHLPNITSCAWQSWTQLFQKAIGCL